MPSPIVTAGIMADRMVAGTATAAAAPGVTTTATAGNVMRGAAGQRPSGVHASASGKGEKIVSMI
jgi:hypothetical protein